MTRQPPLMENATGGNLPGPLFTGRPGWGGQLRNWLAKNAYVLTFRLVLAVAMALVVVSIIRNRPTQVTVVLSPSPAPTTETVTTLRITARPGEGISQLAARAFDDYVAANPQSPAISAAQHFFAVDQLWRTFSGRALKPGDALEFSVDMLEAAISAAKTHRK